MDLFSRSGLFPNGLFDETRRTLNILVPLFAPSASKWFKQEMSAGFFSSGRPRYRPDPAVAASGSMSQEQRKLEHFTYFRDRLVILKEEYDAHEPQSVMQYWYDYRKPAQWWTFWIAVLVFIFGVTQVIEGAIQCYKAYHPST
ncbi:hypothetical protein PV08_11566 [Exophiala spinifera]|uniref:Uncharacterized protein n=1 Tax=Exophiala spinifera TaxID=91928 RepID=A0A0D1ZC65_9EURO|nr:uncharacterized protein PV08_11566 [Exophiala spinifera]KIW10602.1 hypothetical protein PV08_11566 [Exophiala spinifera]